MQRKSPLSIRDRQWNSDSDSNFPSVKRPETSHRVNEATHIQTTVIEKQQQFSQHRCDSTLSSPFKQEVQLLPAGPVGPSSGWWFFGWTYIALHLPLIHAPPTLVVLLIV